MGHTALSQELEEKLRLAQALLLDCDGVLTQGGLYYSAEGPSLLRFHARDGWGIASLTHGGFPVGVISGRDLAVAQKRLGELRIHPSIGRAKDKKQAVLDACQTLSVDPKHTIFVGDDLPDLGAFAAVGIRIAVADATAELRQVADHVTSTKGGYGAVREVCEDILRAKGWLESLLGGLAP